MNTTLHLQAKVEAVKWALWLASKLEIKAIYIEIDSKIFHDPSQPPWRIRSRIAKMHNLLATFSNVFVSWIPRMANMAALFWLF